MQSAVETEGLSKRYALGTVGGYDTLREAIGGALLGRSEEKEEIWALRDVSLEIAKGQSLGVVGRNGAGKSTLLRLLARITEPTSGVARVQGRVGTLLEVGTGFHPELTGVENVYLGGAVLGMRRREVAARFDEIVDFAGIDGFLDTPVKRYSSGMYLRLAFSVAAHLESEVLLVDEVLAVGDAEFQRRCLGKMGDLEREGRTVVFVSHDTSAITDLCQRAIWLEGGQLVEEGPATEVASRYMAALFKDATGPASIPRHSGPMRLTDVSIESQSADGRPVRGEPITVRLALRGQATPGLDLAIYVLDSEGRRVVDDALSDHARVSLMSLADAEVRVTLPPLLRAGDYALGVWLGTGPEVYIDAPVKAFSVAPGPGDHEESLRRPRLVQPVIDWETSAE